MEKINEKVLSWADFNILEDEAKQQVENISKMPFTFRHIALMPDAHLGKGATVGSVIATRGAIIPAAVGVDIGCGMIAVLTKFKANDLPDNLEGVRSGIERRIPLGAGAKNQKISSTAESRIQELQNNAFQDYSLVDYNWCNAMGTLGSGNHFIEICLDETDRVWVVLHSGSRGIGNKLAQIHIKVAQKLMDDMFIPLPDKDLAYLPEFVPQFGEYITDLLWAQDFARLNRDEMMDRVMTELSYTFYKEGGHEKEIEIDRINCHHNFTQKEHHFGKDVWLTRKGAIQMKKGQRGVIPGSMGTHSYIVEGLENPLSYHSAPHGAGRRMSRSAARKKFTLKDLEEVMPTGVAYRHSESLIDEIPMAYKDINEVMDRSSDLVHIVHELKQVVNVKGD